MRLCTVIFVLFLFGCTDRKELILTTNYLTPDNLASHSTRSPDPERIFPRVGEQLRIQWKLPDCPTQHKIDVTVRFGNQCERELTVIPTKKKGSAVYSLLNEEYFEKQGIQTYHATLTGPDGLVASWKHPMWVELIEITGIEEPVE